MIDQCDFVEEGVAHHIYCLIQEKIALCGELITQCRELEPKRIELDLNSNSFGDSHSEHRLEATNTQGKIQILARSMEDNEKLLQSILGSLSGEPQLKDENDETQPLQDEHVNRHELEARCESLGHDIEFFNSENDILRHQNIRLQDEIQRLRSRLGPAEAQVDPVRSDVDEESESNDCEKAEEGSLPLEQRQIRSHAEQLLDWADRAIERGRNAQEDVCGSSIASSFATYLRPSLHSHSDEFFRHESWVSAANDGENHCLISNMTNIGHEGHCSCRNSIFSSNPELVDFYLPKLGVMCSCGRKEDVPLQGTDPCHLVNILRDWQVEFLGSLGLQTAVDLLHACAKTSKPLAKEMRMWRKENGLLSVRTKSCCIALRIWTRTCQAVIKAVRENEVGTIGRPEFLDVSLSSDTFTVSTLGFGGSFAEARKFSDVQ